MKTIVFSIIGLITIFSTTILHAGGTSTGNGGGFAICPDKRAYAADYLISAKNSMGPQRTVLNFRQDLEIILFEMRRLQDPLAQKFAVFVSQLFTQPQGEQTFIEHPYSWKPQRLIQTILGTSSLRTMFFPQCEVWIPTFILFQFFGENANIEIDYDPQVINTILQQVNGHQQLSYLIFHEWLWIATPDSAPKQKAYYNRLVHSVGFSQMNARVYHQLRERFFDYNQNRNDFVNIRLF